jgi:hypothetical protein
MAATVHGEQNDWDGHTMMARLEDNSVVTTATVRCGVDVS